MPPSTFLRNSVCRKQALQHQDTVVGTAIHTDQPASSCHSPRSGISMDFPWCEWLFPCGNRDATDVFSSPVPCWVCLKHGNPKFSWSNVPHKHCPWGKSSLLNKSWLGKVHYPRVHSALKSQSSNPVSATDPKVHLHLEFPTDDRKKSPVVLQGTTTLRLAS